MTDTPDPDPKAEPDPPAEFDPDLDFEPYDEPDAPARPELWDRVGDVHPGWTYALVLAVLVAFAFELAGAWGHRGDLWSSGTVQGPAIERGAAAWARLRQGEWWRVLAPLFLHANVLHVTSNLVALVVAGGVVERVFGHTRFLVLFTLCGVAAAAASCAHQAAAGAAAAGSIGASGAAYGVGAAVVAAAVRLRGLVPPWRARALVGATMPLLLSSLAAGFAHPEIDSAAHVGGAVAGFLLGLCIPFSPRLTLVPEPFAARAGWALAAAAAVVALAGSAAFAFGPARPL